MIWCLSSIVLLISVSFFFALGLWSFIPFFCLSLTVGLDTFLILIAWKLSHINMNACLYHLQSRNIQL